MRLNRKGFTLVELAIVMVIIGLLVGAVLKGQAMIDDAKRNRLTNDIQGISAAYFTYYDKYNAYPGDDSSEHGWSLANDGGDNDGLIEGNAAANNNESEDAWQALRNAGLLSGDPAAENNDALPNHPFGGKIALSNRDFGGSIGDKNYIFVKAIPGSVGESIDIKFDDGDRTSGTVQASAAYTDASVDLYYGL